MKYFCKHTCFFRRRDKQDNPTANQTHSPHAHRTPSYYDRPGNKTELQRHQRPADLQQNRISRGPPIPDDVINSENDYFRTWQLRHAGPQYHDRGFEHYGHGYNYDVRTYPYQHANDAESPDSLNNHVQEHIYESPKFERKHLDLQYHELDPTETLGRCNNTLDRTGL